MADAAPVGHITEFGAGLNAGSAPDGIAAGTDGQMWFTDRGCLVGHRCVIGRITPRGHITESSAGLRPGSHPAGITSGPDGNVWFTDDGCVGVGVGRCAIGRVTPGGHVTEFTNGLFSDSQPWDITAGPDGNVWFTDIGPSRGIGRVTPGGRITEFALPDGLTAYGIAAGPDGNVWFTATGPHTAAIGRITPSGHITLSPAVLPSGSSPDSITAGPDGNLWFVDVGTEAIGRLTRAGHVTEFSSGLTGADLAKIAPGPDGNLWFTNGGAPPSIDRITPSGHITQFPTGLRRGSDPVGIAAGPDGNLWFTDAPLPPTPAAIGRVRSGARAALVASPLLAGSGQAATRLVCEPGRWASWAGQQPRLNAFAFDGYRWLRDGRPSRGRANRFVLGNGDIGHQFSCTVTVSYPLLRVTESVTTAPVTAIPHAPGQAGANPPRGGPMGLARHAELVTCRRAKAKGYACTTKIVSAPVRFSARGASGAAALLRHGAVYASGYARGTRITLLVARMLAPGRYTLALTRRQVTVRRSVTIA